MFDPFAELASTTQMLGTTYFGLFSTMIENYALYVVPVIVVVGLIGLVIGKLSGLLSWTR